MAKDDTSPGGLFSKMVKFVRSPGTQWNDLDEQSSAKSGGLSKHALKEMIERKRRNDFVRKREFDMLRKLRRREASGGSLGEGDVRPSFFQSSMPSRPDDRAQTLKKIDEIEAQMSMQWWKTKHAGGAGPSSIGASSDFSRSNHGAPTSRPSFPSFPVRSENAPSPERNAAYAPTAPDRLEDDRAKASAQALQAGGAMRGPASGVDRAADSYARTSPSALPDASLNAQPRGPSPVPADDDHFLDFTADSAPAGKPAVKATPFSGASPSKASQTPAPTAAPTPPKPVGLGGLAASYDASGTSGFSASKLFAINVDEVQHDPELEEAAIRFANGDDQGAEAGLVEAIGPRGSRRQHDETWLTLFDFYRATGNYDRFESLAIDFANLFGRSAPLWFSIPEMVSKLNTDAPPVTSGTRAFDWKSPAILGIQSVAALNAAVAKAQMPWMLDWAAIHTIEDGAVAPLLNVFNKWASQPVQMRLGHAEALEKVLKQSTPSGVRATDQSRWSLLLAYMRLVGRADEFELAALDFCVTFEVSPPSWESARSEVKLLDADGHTGVGQTIVGDAMHDSIVSELQTDAGSSMMTAQLATVELSGQIMGEPGPVLEKLEARLLGADVLVISCAKLVRVDFSAAGSVLNWVSARQSEGRLVKFTDTHRLVAAFFHVIGISEHAKVITRAD
jgi:ABC-type transporter Mla MlaB component